MMVEIAHINKRESNTVLFPYGKFDIQVRSDDDNPPHFHVIYEDIEITFLIENGELYDIKKDSNNEKLKKYIIKNIPKWLNQKSAIEPLITNRENAMVSWEQIHDED